MRIFFYILISVVLISCKKELTEIKDTSFSLELNTNSLSATIETGYGAYEEDNIRYGCDSDIFMSFTPDSAFAFCRQYFQIYQGNLSINIIFDTIMERKDLKFIDSHRPEDREYFYENYEVLTELYDRDSLAFRPAFGAQGLSIDVYPNVANADYFTSTDKTFNDPTAYFKITRIERMAPFTGALSIDAIKIFAEFACTLYNNDGEAFVIEKSAVRFFYVP